MKIRKFNENKKELDKDYLNMIFCDFIDNKAKVTITELYYIIEMDEPVMKESNNFDSKCNQVYELGELYLDLKSCISKIKDDYPDISIFYNSRKKYTYSPDLLMILSIKYKDYN